MSQKEKDFSKLVKENQGLIIKVARMYTNTPDDQQDLFRKSCYNCGVLTTHSKETLKYQPGCIV